MLEWKLTGLQMGRRFITQLGCIEGCLAYLGREVPAPWIFGGSGHAFVLNVSRRGMHSLHSWGHGREMELVRNVGCVVKRYVLASAEDPHQREIVFSRIRAAIDEECPCFAWGLGHPDYFIVYGYDRDGLHWRMIEDDRSLQAVQIRNSTQSLPLPGPLSPQTWWTQVAPADTVLDAAPAL